MTLQNEDNEVSMTENELPQDQAQNAAIAADCDARAPERGGFTIVELLVAIVILAVGILGLAGTSAVVLQQMNGGNTQMLGSQYAASRFEKMASRACNTYPATGSRYSRGITETWTYVQGDNKTMVATLTLNLQGRKNSEVYQTTISCF